jgi:hypothetical protein
MSFSTFLADIILYLLVERQKEMVTVHTLTSQMTPMKTIRTTLVSAIYRQIGSCFGLFDIAGQTIVEIFILQ